MEEFYLKEDDAFYSIEERKNPYILFHSITQTFPMIIYEDELGNINDYLYYNNINTNNVLNEMEERLKDTKNKDQHSDYYAEKITIADDERITWNWLVNKINKYSNVVLLLSFLEGTLKKIYDWFSKEKNYVGEKRKTSNGKIEYYITEIGKCCNYDLTLELKEELITINLAKKIRNLFVHEWNSFYNEENSESLYSVADEFKITKLINAISEILYECEEAGIRGKIIEKY